MNKKIFILYPHQLFENIEKLVNYKVVLVEEPLFFTQYNFHIQKLVLHRASMKFYQEYLVENNIEVEYYEDESYLKVYKNLDVTLYDVADDWLFKKVQKNFTKFNVITSPNFLNVDDKNKFLHKYYINRRKELDLFIENGKPTGGKWSFDSDNRKKLPKDMKPFLPLSYENRFIQEAKEYCKKFQTYGKCKDFYYPVTFDEARANFEYFLKYKLEYFGDYQDAIVKKESFLYHSNISSSLNIGLLDLQYIIQRIQQIKAPLNSKEGFVRQIIGWREFMVSIYKSSHISLRTTNYFNFTNKIPQKLIDGKSGIAPLDDVIQKLYLSGYNHHIERLMILGNIFLLLEIAPDEVYKFFMARYIDAYDWVMVGNVYGMSGFSDGGSITTKPYISSSNYIIKMSNDYKKSDEWCAIWDGLYWRFLDKYSYLFEKNHRMKMQLSLLSKMDKTKLNKHIINAQQFINKLDNN
jgi:deoxyribodipyrimidine photolyase-related protein